jgi:hypothetical protein
MTRLARWQISFGVHEDKVYDQMMQNRVIPGYLGGRLFREDNEDGFLSTVDKFKFAEARLTCTHGYSQRVQVTSWV